VFVHSTNQKGAVAEAKIAAAAIELGVPVLKPLVEHGRYDLAFEIGSRLLRVQCKWGAFDRTAGVVKLTLQSSRRLPSGYERRTYAEDEIDLVAVYCGDLDRCYLLPSALVAGKRAITLRLSPVKNGQRALINVASQFAFSGAVAQLGERLNGIQEARGSSPLSSTSSPNSSSPHVVGAHVFRNHFGYYMERAAEGDEVLVTRRGKPVVRLVPALDRLPVGG
jgi:prevent-host-death family protein